MRHAVCSRAAHLGIAAILAGVLTACSVHPLPEDVARVSTYDIVERIRCEAQEALRTFPPGDAHARKIIENTQIGYDFYFVISESNSVSGDLELKRTTLAGDEPFTLNLSMDNSVSRANTRTFRLLDSLADIDKADCSAQTVRANKIYPITGATGMGEVVRTYIRLEKLTDLTQRNAHNDVFVDDIKYKTEFTAGLTPTVELKSVVGSLRVRKFSFGGTVERKDTNHDVVVALTRDPNVDVDDLGRRRFVNMNAKAARARTARETWKTNLVVVSSRTLSRVAQRDTEPTTRIILALEHRRNVQADAKVVDRILHGP
jgi:hypothetical protein